MAPRLWPWGINHRPMQLESKAAGSNLFMSLYDCAIPNCDHQALNLVAGIQGSTWFTNHAIPCVRYALYNIYPTQFQPAPSFVCFFLWCHFSVHEIWIAIITFIFSDNSSWKSFTYIWDFVWKLTNIWLLHVCSVPWQSKSHLSDPPYRPLIPSLIKFIFPVSGSLYLLILSMCCTDLW